MTSSPSRTTTAAMQPVPEDDDEDGGGAQQVDDAVARGGRRGSEVADGGEVHAAQRGASGPARVSTRTQHSSAAQMGCAGRVGCTRMGP